MRSLSDVPDTYEPDSDAMVTPGYVSLKGRKGFSRVSPCARIRSRTSLFWDLFCTGSTAGATTLPHRSWKPTYLEKLAAPDFAQPGRFDVDVKRLLAHMLQRDPSARHGYQQLLQQSIWSGQTTAMRRDSRAPSCAAWTTSRIWRCAFIAIPAPDGSATKYQR